MNFASEEKPVIFWADNYTASEAKGGYYLRNPLKEFIESLEKEGETPVAIKFDGSFNLEILVKPKVSDNVPIEDLATTADKEEEMKYQQ